MWAFLFLLQSSTIDPGEVVKYVLLAFIGLGVASLWKDGRQVRDGVLGLIQRLDGSKDQPGLAAIVKDLVDRMESVELWKHTEEKLKEAARESSYTGPERRHHRRRGIDQHLLPDPPDPE